MQIQQNAQGACGYSVGGGGENGDHRLKEQLSHVFQPLLTHSQAE